MSNYLDVINDANKAKFKLPLISEELRIKAMVAMSEAIKANKDLILDANKVDLENAGDIAPVMKKRLSLTAEKLEAIANDVISVANLPSVCNQVLEEFERPNGLKIRKVSQPFGVVLCIFESRPNVVVDIASLCLKTSNVCVLRGGKEALRTNKALVSVMRNAIKEFVPECSINLIEETDHKIVDELLSMKGKIDLAIPRGSARLINHVVETALVPVIETGAGICHIYVDDSADLNMAVDIIINAKTSNPAVCNAAETLLINRKVSKELLKLLKEKNFDTMVVIHGDEEIQGQIKAKNVDSFDIEFDDLEMNFKIVDSVDEAINHINLYGTKHSEVIVTQNDSNALKFMNEIDAACIYQNASSRFTDGGCFGFGAEVGISTGKLHARGPMGLRELMTYKYLINGNGQIRK